MKTEIPKPLLQLESQMSANVTIGKHKILNTEPESEEIIMYYQRFL